MKLKILHGWAQRAHFLRLSFTKNTYKNLIMEHIFVTYFFPTTMKKWGENRPNSYRLGIIPLQNMCRLTFR